MGKMKRVLEEHIEDTMRYWFPEGTDHLSQDEIDVWTERAESTVYLLLDSYGSYAVKQSMLEKQELLEMESKENNDE